MGRRSVISSGRPKIKTQVWKKNKETKKPKTKPNPKKLRAGQIPKFMDGLYFHVFPAWRRQLLFK